MTLISPNYEKEVEADLRKLLEQGKSIKEAVCYLHEEKKIGLLYLWPGVSRIMGIDKKEAKKFLVQNLSVDY